MMERSRSSYRRLDDDALLTPADVAFLFRVDPKTVTRWAAAGRIPRDPVTGHPGAIKTLGGHRRFRWGVIRRVLEGELDLPPAGIPARTTASTPAVVIGRSNTGGTYEDYAQ